MTALKPISRDAIPRALVPFIRSVNRAYHELDCGYDRETSTQDREHVFRRYQTAMLNLVELDTMELSLAFRKLTRVAAEMFDVERVSIWVYDEDGASIVCKTLFTRSTSSYEAGLRLLARMPGDAGACLQAGAAIQVTAGTDTTAAPLVQCHRI